MIQEIITYLIISGAVALALLKIIKRLSKKSTANKSSSEVKKIPSMHNCSNCSAQCNLRSTVKQASNSSFEICGMIEPKS